jgi:hypothetical protein
VSSKLHLHLTLNISAKKILFTTDGSGVSLNGFCMYFLRTSTKRTLGEETFQVQQLTKVKLKEENFRVHCKKGLMIFPSPAGISLTKLSLAGNN